MYEVSPYWFSADEVREASEQLVKTRKEQQQKKQDQDAQATIDQMRRKQTGQERAALEAKLRKESANRANHFRNQFDVEMRAVLEGRRTETFPAALFPAFHRSIGERRGNQWEFVKLETQIEDYGTVDWKGRKLEGVLVRLVVNEKNRILGEYRDHCFVLGLISDADFQMPREPIETDCTEGNARVRTWKMTNSFQSRWFAN